MTLPHGAGIPGGTVPFRYGEARGIFSFEKRMSPRPPKEKRGGISISPRTPLKRHKGAKLRFLPFGNPSEDEGERQRGEEQRVSSLHPNERRAHRCGDAVIRGTSVGAAGRGLLDFAGSAYRSLFRMGELAVPRATHPQASFLLTMNGRFLFGKTKRKWGFNLVRHSRTSPHQFGALGVSKRKWGVHFGWARPISCDPFCVSKNRICNPIRYHRI